MANTKSAIKEIRVAERRKTRNKATRTAVKTRITGAEKQLSTGEIEKGKESAASAISALDKAAKSGILHKNNASRRKGRLMKKINQASAAVKTETKEEKKK